MQFGVLKLYVANEIKN